MKAALGNWLAPGVDGRWRGRVSETRVSIQGLHPPKHAFEGKLRHGTEGKLGPVH